MRAAFFTLILLFVLVATLPSPSLDAQTPSPATPRLVVLLAVDQMRADYLTMPRSNWRAGLRRLLTEGAVFERSEYPYMNTVTCAGHSTIGTGAFPRTHGMTLNGWYDRTRKVSVSCNDDPDAPVISYRAADKAAAATDQKAQESEKAAASAKTGTSAKPLLAPTLADELRAKHPGARVVSISMKARSAIGLAGHGGTAITWIDDTAASFATSRAFSTGPVPEVAAFLKQDRYETEAGRTWALRDPAESYYYPDANIGARPGGGRTGLFPHRVAGVKGPDAQFFTNWQTSPYSDAYLVRMASALIDAYKLGQRDTTDFLGVSLSALDLVGHGFGPESREVEDMVRRLDDTIGALLDHLDRTVGRGRWSLGFSSDHGVAAIPVTTGAGRITTDDVRDRIEEVLITRYGVRKEGNYVASVTFNYVYFTEGVWDRLKADAPTYAAIEKAVLGVPGMVRLLRSDRLSASSDDRDVRSAALSWYPGRSGDIILVGRVNWYFGPRGDPSGTTHGTSHPYDRRVPVILLGAGVKPGRYAGTASPADVAPSLGQIIGVPMPKAEGRVLREALR